MVREAVDEHDGFSGCRLLVYTKGSYPNNTNVRTDSDVDVAVQCTEAEYWDEHTEGAHPPGGTYEGGWTPAKLRSELVVALKAKFPGQVDTSGSTAIRVHSGSARVDADVVPCFDYRYYFAGGTSRPGAKTFKTNFDSVVNFPAQHLKNGKAKNSATSKDFKKTVRIFKRIENAMATGGVFRTVPSYFIECLIYNCPDAVFRHSTWTEVVQAAIVHIWDDLQGDIEPTNDDDRWLEVNECKYLFFGGQKWKRKDGREFAKAAWNFMGYAS
jgi:hypothetical protein